MGIMAPKALYRDSLAPKPWRPILHSVRQSYRHHVRMDAPPTATSDTVWGRRDGFTSKIAYTAHLMSQGKLVIAYPAFFAELKEAGLSLFDFVDLAIRDGDVDVPLSTRCGIEQRHRPAPKRRRNPPAPVLEAFGQLTLFTEVHDESATYRLRSLPKLPDPATRREAQPGLTAHRPTRTKRPASTVFTPGEEENISR